MCCSTARYHAFALPSVFIMTDDALHDDPTCDWIHGFCTLTCDDDVVVGINHTKQRKAQSTDWKEHACVEGNIPNRHFFSFKCCSHMNLRESFFVLERIIAIALEQWRTVPNIYLGYACACDGLLIERRIHLHIQHVSQRMGGGHFWKRRYWKIETATLEPTQGETEMGSTTSSGLFWKSRWNTFSTSCWIYEATTNCHQRRVMTRRFQELVASEVIYIYMSPQRTHEELYREVT